jgi:hypothetical protein
VTTRTIYSDYRTVNGVGYPYTTVIAGVDAQDNQVLRVSSVAFSATVSADGLVRPQNKTTGTIARGTSTTIPFDLDDLDKGHIISRRTSALLTTERSRCGCLSDHSMAIWTAAGAGAAVPRGARMRKTSGITTAATMPMKKKASANAIVAAC